MKYFKITNIQDKEDEWEFYVSSTLENETPAHLALTLHLEGDQYEITEVTKEEFDRETEEDEPEGLLLNRPDLEYIEED